MPSILCSNAGAPVVQLVTASIQKPRFEPFCHKEMRLATTSHLKLLAACSYNLQGKSLSITQYSMIISILHILRVGAIPT